MKEIEEAIREHEPSAVYGETAAVTTAFASTHLASTLPGFKGVVHGTPALALKKPVTVHRDTCERSAGCFTNPTGRCRV